MLLERECDIIIIIIIIIYDYISGRVDFVIPVVGTVIPTETLLLFITAIFCSYYK
jgi:hypothetical protein